MADLDEVIARLGDDLAAACVLGGERHHLAERLLLHLRDEAPDDVEIDVALEQRDAHVPQRLLDVGRRQLDLTAQAIARGLEAFGDGLEHGRRPG